MGVCLFVQTCISLGKTLIKIWNANDSSNGVQIGTSELNDLWKTNE